MDVSRDFQNKFLIIFQLTGSLVIDAREEDTSIL